ncbi:MAG: S24 family peptidase [Alphaproteobacteria bacterium]
MDWLKQHLERVGKTPTDLARWLGIPPPRVYEMLKGKRRLQQDEIDKTAQLFGISVSRVLAMIAGKSDPGPELSEATHLQPSGHLVNPPELPNKHDMARDIPVFGTSMGGDGNGDFEMNGQIVDYVRRPPRLSGRTDVFAIYIQGTSMSPWRDPGDIAYVEKSRPPRAGDYVVIEFQGDVHNVRSSLIKKLVGISPTKIKLQQYNPPKIIEIDRLKNRYQIYRVIDWTELMGV